MTILNLTQHNATQDQLQAGVVDLPVEIKERLVSLITFDTIPSEIELITNANSVANLATAYFRELAETCDLSTAEKHALDLDKYAPGLNSYNNVTMASVMIGGAPFFMSHLESALGRSKIRPMYAFSARESVDIEQEDGSISKTTVFKHLGFVKV